MPRKSEIKSTARNDISSYFSKSALPNLRSYFGLVESGQPDIYDTPFAKGESTDELLSKWMAILESISKEWPSLWEFEKDLAKKVGPLSIMEPLAERMKDIESYYEGIHLPSEPIHKYAIERTLNEWGAHRGVHVRDQWATIELMKKSTNSGSPYFTKRRAVVDTTYKATTAIHEKHVIQRLMVQRPNSTFVGDEENVWDACAVLGWRGQEGGPTKEDVKQRVVWMFPFAVNIRELQVYQPCIEVAQKFNIYPAWVSLDAVDRGITELFDSKGSDDLIICTDFTKFDQHFNEDCQEAAKTMISAILTPNKEASRWLNEVFEIKYMIPLMYNYNTVKYGHHGMGSGSGGTNFDETLVHKALQHEAAFRNGKRLNPNSQCLGDDGILSYPGISVKDVVETYSRHGLEMNLDKQYASTQDCVYLRRWHHKDYRLDGICAGVYATTRALGRLRYLERYMNPEVWDAKAVALRQLSILENVKYHPLKDQFAEFCMKRDKYRLGIDIPNFLRDIQQIAKEKIDLMPDFLGYTRTLQAQGSEYAGIGTWWIVNYLKSKA